MLGVVLFLCTGVMAATPLGVKLSSHSVLDHLANAKVMLHTSLPCSDASCTLSLHTLILSFLIPLTIITSNKPRSPLDQEQDDLDDYYQASWLPSFPFIQHQSLLFQLNLYHYPQPTNPCAHVLSLMDLFVSHSLSRAQARPSFLLFSLLVLTFAL